MHHAVATTAAAAAVVAAAATKCKALISRKLRLQAPYANMSSHQRQTSRCRSRSRLSTSIRAPQRFMCARRSRRWTAHIPSIIFASLPFAAPTILRALKRMFASERANERGKYLSTCLFSADLKITIIDTNNHEPQFDKPWYSFDVCKRAMLVFNTRLAQITFFAYCCNFFL